MAMLNAAITRGFDLLLAPFGGRPWAGLAFISLVTGAGLLLVFRAASNQRGIKAVKSQIIAHLLEVVLYRDELRVVLRAQARLARDNLRYLGHALAPLAVAIIPLAVLVVQADLRYGRRPLQVGERAVVTAALRPGVDIDGVSLAAPPEVEVETAALRIPSLNEVAWRVRAVVPGRHVVRVRVGEEDVEKELVVGGRLTRVSAERVGGGGWRRLRSPGEPPLPAGSSVILVAVRYPAADMELLGRRMSWVWPWLAMAMVFGYALKGPLRVSV